MDNAIAYVWLDVLKRQLINDVASDEEIKAIEHAQSLLREEITGFAEE